MAQSNVCPLRMAPPCKNPMQAHLQRRNWLTDRHHTHCTDPVIWATVTARRHKVVQQRGTIAQATQKRKQNHATTRAHQKRHRNANKNYFCVCVSVNTSTLQRIWHNGRYLLFSTVLQPTLTRTTNGNTSWALHKMLTKKHVSVGAKNFVKTHGVPTPSPMRKKTTKVSPFNGVRTQNKTHMAHDTSTNKPTILRLAVCHVTVLYKTLHTDPVCPKMMFPNDMTNHYPTHKS